MNLWVHFSHVIFFIWKSVEESFLSDQDDLIISSGYRIGPFEVESALIEHEAVKESAVVPSPDSDRGQVVKAFVVLSDKYKHVRGDKEKETELKGKNTGDLILSV